MKGILVALLMFLVVVVQLGEAITCGEVDLSLAPCLPYLIQGGDPPVPCCDGVKKLVQITPTQQDRQVACECVKSAAARYTNLKPDAATNLLSRCGVTTNIPISPTIDCKTWYSLQIYESTGYMESALDSVVKPPTQVCRKGWNVCLSTTPQGRRQRIISLSDEDARTTHAADTEHLNLHYDTM
ncbi:Non-specific lipid-transfer protein 1 [Capsicum annuum]|nr:Non-specific lipid-transfer protein 1 [Capsicum annuum]KAF3682367.1 Non-specific lipid-transfer protein 1 [Capsicum annuum]